MGAKIKLYKIFHDAEEKKCHGSKKLNMSAAKNDHAINISNG